MVKRLLSVGGFTLLSRITGFFRDVLMAFVLGNGALSDSFLVAFLSELFSCNFRRRHDQSRIPAALCGSQS